jgi:hypothetical protein
MDRGNEQTELVSRQILIFCDERIIRLLSLIQFSPSSNGKDDILKNFK